MAQYSSLAQGAGTWPPQYVPFPPFPPLPPLPLPLPNRIDEGKTTARRIAAALYRHAGCGGKAIG
jgi:hypothetical protein